MYLAASFNYRLTRFDCNENVVPWRIDLKAYDEEYDQSFVVGRTLMDELKRFDILEWGDHPWDAADADSGGLQAAYSYVVNADGEIRDDFEASGSSIVYIYRFEIHSDFLPWRMAFLDSVCRLFDSDAIILAQCHTTHLSLSEFAKIGFVDIDNRGDDSATSSVLDKWFVVRDNACTIDYAPSDYPDEYLFGQECHQDWLENSKNWQDII